MAKGSNSAAPSRSTTNYLFTIEDSVANKGSAPVSLYPYALISRHGKPEMLGYYILHEGLIGVMGDQGLQEIAYSDIESKKTISFKVTNAWLGITDKYWAATLLPDIKANLQARFSAARSRQPQDLPDRLSARSGDRRAGRHRHREGAAVRRRQGSRGSSTLTTSSSGSTASSC